MRQRLAPATVLAGVQEGWAQAAGAEVARHSEPVSERGGVVTVRCESGVWAAELSMMSEELLERLNEARDGRQPGARDPLRRGRLRAPSGGV